MVRVCFIRLETGNRKNRQLTEYKYLKKENISPAIVFAHERKLSPILKQNFKKGSGTRPDAGF
jgi:uncharacterized protein (DUF433 family)